MTDLLWAVVGGLMGSAATLALGAVAAIRVWGARGVRIAENRRAVEQLEKSADDLEQRVRRNKELLDRHIGSYRGESLCTRSE